MGNLGVLLAGEVQRLVKYNIFSATLVVALIWIATLYFTGAYLFTLVIFVDATIMSITLVAVTIFFEKQEGSLKSLLVSPITRLEHVLAKACGNIVNNILTVVILYLYAWYYFGELELNFFALLGAVILIALFHALLGLILTYYSKTFTDLLTNMMKYAFVMMFPVFFEQVGLIQNELAQNLMYLLPTKASLVFLTASAGGLQPWEIWFSGLYLAVGSLVLLWAVLRKFDEFAVRESG